METTNVGQGPYRRVIEPIRQTRTSSRTTLSGKLLASETGGPIKGGRVGSIQDTGRKDTSSGFLVGNLVAWKGRLRRRRSEPEEIRTLSFMTPLQDGTTLYACTIVQEIKQDINSSRKENRT